tara:strand:- start:25 stop:222 length:198 start_codon:yes stop_codon:yes gene_type:complete
MTSHLTKGSKLNLVIEPKMLKDEKYIIQNYGIYIKITLLEEDVIKRNIIEERLKLEGYTINLINR